MWELVSCIEVTLVSKFHPIWCLIAKESKLGTKFLGGSDIFGKFYRIYPPRSDISGPR
jgi:hypothetical protein